MLDRITCICFGMTTERKEYSLSDAGYRLDAFDIDYSNTGVFMHVRVSCKHHPLLFIVHPDRGIYEGAILQ